MEDGHSALQQELVTFVENLRNDNQALQQEVDRIVQSTKFQDKTLLDGSFGLGLDAATTLDANHVDATAGAQDLANRNKLEEEREKKTIDEIVAKNNVQVPEDFDVPEVTDEQIQQAMEEQRKAMGLPDEGEDSADAPPPPSVKPEGGQ